MGVLMVDRKVHLSVGHWVVHWVVLMVDQLALSSVGQWVVLTAYWAGSLELMKVNQSDWRKAFLMVYLRACYSGAQ